MAKSVYAAMLLALSASVASAHHEGDASKAPPAQMITSMPSEAWTVTDWYKQSIYDPSDTKVGEINDVLVDHDGKINAIVIGVGGFLGVGQKDVAVPYDAVFFTNKDNKYIAHINATNDSLKAAPGYKFDRTARKWMPDTSDRTTTGGPGTMAPPVKQ